MTAATAPTLLQRPRHAVIPVGLQELSLADVKKDRPLDYGPVGQLSGVHRDFMLLVLPYTFQKG